MFRKPLFWIGFSALSVLSLVFSIKFFPRAFPIINIDLSMNRQQALASARSVAARHGWGPPAFRQTASFDVDQEVQNYVELEGGGKDAFSLMIRQGLYAPYTWTVRHFREGEAHESFIAFKPDGRPCGFKMIVPETEACKNVSSKEARYIAEKTAADDWGAPLHNYDLVEQSEELRIGGRRDHVFVYERNDVKIGDGSYRLRLAVTGNRLTELKYFIKIPEAFTRRFKEMRSANNTISSVADIVAGVLYVLGGCVLGLFILLKKRRVIVRAPVLFGLGIAGLQVLGEINAWPLEWMNYDTALSYGGFVFDHASAILYRFVIDFALLSLSFMAAESLSRRAFPEHIQLFKIWTKDGGGSVQVAGRTIGGYLLVAVFCAYQLMLYYVATRFRGWWTPSDTLIEPNIFAAYFPWFSSFATALHAGFWEESLFRAVPIACGAIIGERYGRRGWGVTIAIIAQAVIFGAAHANYPNEPSYARLVELILPATGFGLLYLYFGLLPAVILHFTFDALWISLPLFISSAPGVWGDRLLVVATVLSPLWIVLLRRHQNRRWVEFPSAGRNAAWTPPEQPEYQAAEPCEERISMPKRTGRMIMTAASIGLMLWAVSTRFKSDVPPLEAGKSASVRTAKEALAKEGFAAPPPWKIVTIINGDPDPADRFVWQKGGEKVYRELMARGYLFPPLWLVRFARFEGDIVARAEEYHILISGRGKIFGVSHQVPENMTGATLSEADARALAEAAIRHKYSVDVSKLAQISATPSKLPARQNWEFVYEYPPDNPLKEGQTRITAVVEGREVAQIYKSVYIPEEWKRQERNRMNLLGILESLSSIVTIILFIAGLVIAVLGWARSRFSVSIFMRFFVSLVLLEMIHAVNRWPNTVARFSTTEPLINQLLLAGGLSFLMALLVSLDTAIINGFIGQWKRSRAQLRGWVPVVVGIGAGIIASGALALTHRLLPQYGPVWPHFADVNMFFPFIGTGVGAVIDFIKLTTLYLLIFAAFDRMTDGWKTRKLSCAVLVVLLGVSISGAGSIDSVGAWLLSGVVLSAAIVSGYVFVFRYCFCLVPFAAAGMSLLNLGRQAVYRAYPYSVAGNAFAMFLVMAAAYYWYCLLNVNDKRDTIT